MHIRPKTTQEIETMQASGRILNDVFETVVPKIAAGTTLRAIDQMIYETIVAADAKPSFLGYKDFPASSCLSLNSVVVHGIPSDSVLAEGDLLGIDIGVYFEGYHTDSAVTKYIGETPPEDIKKLLTITQEALKVGLEAAIAGNRVGDIGTTIETYVQSQGQFGIIRDLSGHGIGQSLQELPEVLNYRNTDKTPLTNGMTLAIEPMLTLGSDAVTLEEDGWAVRTADNSLTAHFETTLVINNNDPMILVPFPLHFHG